MTAKLIWMQQAIERFCAEDANVKKLNELIIHETCSDFVFETFVCDISENMREMVFTREYQRPSLKKTLISRGLSLSDVPNADSRISDLFEDHQPQKSVPISGRDMQISYTFIFRRWHASLVRLFIFPCDLSLQKIICEPCMLVYLLCKFLLLVLHYC